MHKNETLIRGTNEKEVKESHQLLEAEAKRARKAIQKAKKVTADAYEKEHEGDAELKHANEKIEEANKRSEITKALLDNGQEQNKEKIEWVRGVMGGASKKMKQASERSSKNNEEIVRELKRADKRAANEKKALVEGVMAAKKHEHQMVARISRNAAAKVEEATEEVTAAKRYVKQSVAKSKKVQKRVVKAISHRCLRKHVS